MSVKNGSLQIKVIFNQNTNVIEKWEARMKQRAHLRKRLKRLKQKERQSIVLLGLILIGFIACWLPFFVVYILSAFKIECSKLVFTIFFWLGYCNSGVNPVIYTIFQREFRQAFVKQLKRMLICRKEY
jgi:hypothetical protein